MKNYIVYKETLNRALSRWYDEKSFSNMVDETNEISSIIIKSKKDNINAGISNYGRIPYIYFTDDFVPNPDDSIDRLLILIAGYINTYCGNFKRIKIQHICNKIDLDKETLTDMIIMHGSQYGLYYLREKDRFRRIHRYIVLDIKKEDIDE